VVAGIFQFSPLKQRFHNACHTRFGVLVRACRSGEGSTWLLRSVAGTPIAAPENAVPSGQTLYSGGYAITLRATRGKPGTNIFVVTLGNSVKGRIAQAEVVILATMLDMDMGTEQVLLQPATRGEPGIYEGPEVELTYEQLVRFDLDPNATVRLALEHVHRLSSERAPASE